MYAANLSWKPTQRVLAQLVEQELVREISGDEGVKSRRRYEITEKGVSVLNYFDKAKELLSLDEVYANS
jgi:predicted transcriptional regulator